MSVDKAPRIALDAMGGDGGPATMIAGAAIARSRDSDLHFMLFGDEAEIRQELQHTRSSPSRSSSIATT